MINLIITNKKVQHTAKAESTNFKVDGIVTIDGITSKVMEYNGTIYTMTTSELYIGNFNYNQNNISINLQQDKDLIAEVSQLITDIISGTELELTKTV